MGLGIAVSGDAAERVNIEGSGSSSDFAVLIHEGERIRS